MEKKLFTFSMEFEFVADTEEEAVKQFQEMIYDWEDSVTSASNWFVEVQDVEVSES